MISAINFGRTLVPSYPHLQTQPTAIPALRDIGKDSLVKVFFQNLTTGEMNSRTIPECDSLLLSTDSGSRQVCLSIGATEADAKRAFALGQGK